eukprot:TRINITY_DN6609_c0_g1_i9.p1 TRINITY_DN6609_c0_g1~~TRINITY_DN6609_c0_g1_i9.p1  ORF type:complete len:116 (+),score=38.10 TRINITY_DN6609_c0_g1_i9:40-348(+)
MNAALRAKLMDPMVLNLQGKDKKKEGTEKDAKKRVERDVEESEDSEAAEAVDADEEEWKWRWKLLQNWSTGWAKPKDQDKREIKTKKRRKSVKRPKRTKQRM